MGNFPSSSLFFSHFFPKMGIEETPKSPQMVDPVRKLLSPTIFSLIFPLNQIPYMHKVSIF